MGWTAPTALPRPEWDHDNSHGVRGAAESALEAHSGAVLRVHFALTAQLMFDISIVLNLHNEARYLRRTMLSLEDAVRFAKRYEISFELVVVLDRPDALTIAWIEAYDFAAFNGYQIITVDNGSLGLSRNDGIRAAQGEYIATADGDDLISYNSFVESLSAARGNQRAIHLPQYLCAFGTKYFVWKYFGSERIPNSSLFDQHPYISRIFVHREFFSRIKYEHPRSDQGYAYEDWHLSMCAAAAGYAFAIVPNVVLFYRQRPNSIMATAQHLDRIQPFSPFLRPTCFLKSTVQAKVATAPAANRLWEEVRTEFFQSHLLTELIHAANRTDPAINYQRFLTASFGSNLPHDSLGAIYRELSALIGNRTFTDVVLLPFLAPGGAEKYLLQVIGALSRLDPKRSVLVLAGQQIARHHWIDKLPPQALFVDLYRTCTGRTQSELELIVLRLIQATAQRAEIHVKISEFANNFIWNHCARLDECSINLYYFCDSMGTHNGRHFVEGSTFDLLSEHQNRIRRVISDHRGILESVSDKLDVCKARFEPLYAEVDACASSRKLARSLDGNMTGRLLWASRLDSQKRPDLLTKIAGALASVRPQITIDVYGSAVLNAFDVNLFSGLKNIRYMGPYSGFDELSAQNYDAFLYTSAFDGLPNVVLEAMESGLLVIAPNVGGIGESVTAHTGLLIENSTDDAVLVQRYVDAIARLYESADLGVLRANAQQLIRERHSREAYLTRVAEIFDLADSACAEPAE